MPAFLSPQSHVQHTFLTINPVKILVVSILSFFHNIGFQYISPCDAFRELGKRNSTTFCCATSGRAAGNWPLQKISQHIIMLFVCHPKLFSVSLSARAEIPYISYIYRYVPPHRVEFLRRFGLKTGIHFAHFGMESSVVFEGTTKSVRT